MTYTKLQEKFHRKNNHYLSTAYSRTASTQQTAPITQVILTTVKTTTNITQKPTASSYVCILVKQTHWTTTTLMIKGHKWLKNKVDFVKTWNGLKIYFSFHLLTGCCDCCCCESRRTTLWEIYRSQKRRSENIRVSKLLC